MDNVARWRYADRMATAITSGTIPTWTLGDRLRKARVTSKTSTAAMAEALGVDRKTVGNYEAMRTPISRGNILAWSLLTGVDTEWLLTGSRPDDGPGGSVTPIRTGNRSTPTRRRSYVGPVVGPMAA